MSSFKDFEKFIHNLCHRIGSVSGAHRAKDGSSRVLIWQRKSICRNLRFLDSLYNMFGMTLHVIVEMALIGESCSASHVVALVRLLACMESQMSLEVALFVECGGAPLVWADEVAHSVVLFQVNVKSCFLAV